MTDFDEFEEWFCRDLEKWFTADIACCDNCYDDFLNMWPHAENADDYQFQNQGCPLDIFYSGSNISSRYTKDEFDKYIRQIECPRCGSPLQFNIWAYNLPFNVPEGFEKSFREIYELAQTTPFLLLENAFCLDILKAIRHLGTITPASNFSQKLFRARSEEHGPVEQCLASFDFPPASVVKEGRYNHAGQPVLYLGSDIDTCHAEIRYCKAIVAGFSITKSLKVLDLTNAFVKHPDYADLLNCLVYSALVSARQDDEGWYKRHYVVSRFVADCARTAGFDAVKYPSTRKSGANFNLVILNSAFLLSSIAIDPEFFKIDARILP